ncbi:MAG: hypothetical protein WAL16_09315 [Streptosporangiaceae bacterium]
MRDPQSGRPVTGWLAADLPGWARCLSPRSGHRRSCADLAPPVAAQEPLPRTDADRQQRQERIIRELVDATTELLAELADRYPQLGRTRLRVVGDPEQARRPEHSQPLADVIQLRGRQ